MTHLDEQYWSQRYTDSQIGWDLGQVSPPLAAYIQGLEDKEQSILIPGAGNAHEWKHLISKGFVNSTVVDLSLTPLIPLRKAYPEHTAQLIHEDFFDHEGQYDLILEQTFFCALHPRLRAQYVKKMHSLLTPNGRIVGLLFNREFEKEGPPFGGSEGEYRSLFSEYFDIHRMEECRNSIPPRQGHELFIHFGRKQIGE